MSVTRCAACGGIFDAEHDCARDLRFAVEQPATPKAHPARKVAKKAAAAVRPLRSKANGAPTRRAAPVAPRETRAVTLHLPRALARRLRLAAADEERTMSAIAVEALDARLSGVRS